MAILHGKNANVYWDSQGSDTAITQCQSWSLDVTHDVVEITSMQDAYKTYLGGFTDWTATVEQLEPAAGTDIGYDNAGNPDGMGQRTARLELYVLWDTGTPLYKVLYGNAICTSVDSTIDKDSPGKASYNFQGIGQMQWASGASRP